MLKTRSSPILTLVCSKVSMFRCLASDTRVMTEVERSRQQQVEEQSRVIGMTPRRRDGVHEVLIRGFSYQDFDNRTGYLSLFSMLNMQLKSRQLFEVQEPPGYSGSVVFMFQLRIFFSPRLHNKMSGLFNFPMISTSQLVNYWKTSYCMKQTIRTEDTNEWLNTVYVKNVNIDPIKQSPKSLPEEFVKKCQSALTKKEDIPIFVFPTSVKNPFSCHVCITFSDTDHFLHLSHMTCMQYCLDCGRAAAVAGHFSIFKKDLCYYPIIRLEGLFLGQSTYGDLLTIQTWEDEHSADTLHFIVAKGPHEIFKATYQFQLNKDSRL